LIFYIYISHDNEERKRKILEGILDNMHLIDEKDYILQLCKNPPLQRKVSQESGNFS
jgi:hypothetical protein